MLDALLIKHLFCTYLSLLNYITIYSLHISTLPCKTPKRILKSYPTTQNFHLTFYMGDLFWTWFLTNFAFALSTSDKNRHVDYVVKVKKKNLMKITKGQQMKKTEEVKKHCKKDYKYHTYRHHLCSCIFHNEWNINHNGFTAQRLKRKRKY